MPRAVELKRDSAPDSIIDVIVGILVDTERRVLIAERPVGKHMAGAWEFPGGKLEPGEAAFAGLKREIEEELGVRIRSAEPFLEHRHRYPDRLVRLDVWWVLEYAGRAAPLEGQSLRWVGSDELLAAQMLPADAPLVSAVIGRLGRPGPG
jgi:8-oxo-dGTP diphosphatase